MAIGSGFGISTDEILATTKRGARLGSTGGACTNKRRVVELDGLKAR
jgi:hypothetical protein